MLDRDEYALLRAAEYRVLRALHPASRRTFLAVREDDACPVVIRKYALGEDADSRSSAVQSPHGLRLLDVLSDSSGQVFVVEEYAERGALADFFEPESHQASECVTLMTVVLEHLSVMMDAGLVPEQLLRRDLLLDGNGLVRFRNGGRFIDSQSGGWPNALSTLERDVDDILGWLTAQPQFARHVQFQRPLRASHWRAGIRELNASCPAVPIVVRAEGDVPMLPSRIGDAPVEMPEEVPGRATVADILSTLRFRIPPWVVRFGEVVRAHRKPLLFGALGTGLIVVAVSLFAPAAPRKPTAPDSLWQLAGGSATSGTSNAATAGQQEFDPRIASELLHLRASCRSGDLACLNTVDEPGSALFAKDAQRLDDALPLRLSAGIDAQPQVVSTMGQAVLVSMRSENTSASVLLMQTEAGWRIRDVFD
ncbi:MAG: hypothetical protein ACKOXM_06740 [Agromyces sp.]